MDCSRSVLSRRQTLILPSKPLALSSIIKVCITNTKQTPSWSSFCWSYGCNCGNDVVFAEESVGYRVNTPVSVRFRTPDHSMSGHPVLPAPAQPPPPPPPQLCWLHRPHVKRLRILDTSVIPYCDKMVSLWPTLYFVIQDPFFFFLTKDCQELNICIYLSCSVFKSLKALVFWDLTFPLFCSRSKPLRCLNDKPFVPLKQSPL